MKKLEALTAEQIAKMAVVRDEWLDYGLKPQVFDRERFDRGIRWLYCDIMKKPMPDVLVVEPHHVTALSAMASTWPGEDTNSYHITQHT